MLTVVKRPSFTVVVFCYSVPTVVNRPFFTVVVFCYSVSTAVKRISYTVVVFSCSVLTVVKRPSFTVVGTPATVTTLVNRYTGRHTCQSACRPRITRTPTTLRQTANQTAPGGPVPIATLVRDPHNLQTLLGCHLPQTPWKWR